MSEQRASSLEASSAPTADIAEHGLTLLDLVVPLAEHFRLLVIVPLLAGLAALGIAYVVPETFTAKTTFLPPQQQNTAASAIASLGTLAALTGGIASIRTPADQYVALMQSAVISDRLIDQFGLMSVYDARHRVDARKVLAESVRITIGKKDGLISVEVDDNSPQRAADVANAYVDELRRLTSVLAVTEAQQRRAFFERQMLQTRDNLAQAQLALQSTGFSQGALRAEPRAAAESYAKLRAEVTAAEVRLQTLRGSFADNAPEVVTQQTTLSSLRGQLALAERATATSGDPDYVGKYREFKYQEVLFDLFARQYELARVDESREGAIIQVVDVATPPERKSKPKRALIALMATTVTSVLLILTIIVRETFRRASADPASRYAIRRILAALSEPRRQP